MTFAHRGFPKAVRTSSDQVASFLTTDNWMSGDQSAAFDAAYGACRCICCANRRASAGWTPAGPNGSDK